MENTLQRDGRDDVPSLKGDRAGALMRGVAMKARFTAEWNEADNCFLCLSKKSFQRNPFWKATVRRGCCKSHLQRDYPRDLTEFEARFANEPACRDLPVPIALAGRLSVSPSPEE